MKKKDWNRNKKRINVRMVLGREKRSKTILEMKQQEKKEIKDCLLSVLVGLTIEKFKKLCENQQF